jgi:hypothetical protein
MVNKAPFWILNLTVTYNKRAIFKYGGLARYLNDLNKTTMLQYSYNFIRHSKEVAKAVRYETHNWKILGSNPAALNISFFKDPISSN